MHQTDYHFVHFFDGFCSERMVNFSRSWFDNKESPLEFPFGGATLRWNLNEFFQSLPINMFRWIVCASTKHIQCFTYSTLRNSIVASRSAKNSPKIHHLFSSLVGVYGCFSGNAHRVSPYVFVLFRCCTRAPPRNRIENWKCSSDKICWWPKMLCTR